MPLCCLSVQWQNRTERQHREAAQEQALSTRSIEAGIYHTRQDSSCRQCKDALEIVQQGVKMLAGRGYVECHNQVTGIVTRNLYEYLYVADTSLKEED